MTPSTLLGLASFGRVHAKRTRSCLGRGQGWFRGFGHSWHAVGYAMNPADAALMTESMIQAAVWELRAAAYVVAVVPHFRRWSAVPTSAGLLSSAAWADLGYAVIASALPAATTECVEDLVCLYAASSVAEAPGEAAADARLAAVMRSRRPGPLPHLAARAIAVRQACGR